MLFKKLSAIESIRGNSPTVQMRNYKNDLLNSIPLTIKPIFSKINFKMTNGTMHITPDLSVTQFIDMLKKGDFHTAFHMANPRIHLNAAQLALLYRHVDTLPEFHMNNQKIHTDKLKKKIPADVLKKLENVQNANDFEKLMNSNLTLTNTMNSLIKELKKGRGTVRGFSFKFKVSVLVIGGSALLYSQIENYRSMMSGCLLYQYKNKEMKTCKLVSHSCRNGKSGDDGSDYEKCDESVLPKHIRENNCLTSNWTEARPVNKQQSGCHNCSLNLNNANDLSVEGEYGNMKLVCNENVSLISAIGDIVYHLPNNIQSTVTSVWKYVKYIVAIFILVLLFYIIYYVRQFMSNMLSFM